MQFGIRHGANQAHADTEYLICSDELAVDPARVPISGQGATWLRWDDGFPTGSEQPFLGAALAL